MTAIDLPKARRLAFSLVLGQAAVTGVAGLLAFGLAGGRAALSALLGGGISTVASLVMVVLSFARSTGADAQRALAAFYAGEAAKIAVAVALFVVVLKTMKVVPLALLGAYMATFLVYWAALASALPGLRGGNRADEDR